MRQQFLSYVAQTSPAPMGLEISHGDGVYLYDTSGKPYIDLISGIAVSSLGHQHPAVVKAVQEQAGRYMHTMVYGEYVLAPQTQLATELSQALGGELDSVYFVNSGSEAVEGAMKLAKRVTGRHEIISMTNAYHGSSQGAASLMSDPTYTQAFRPLLPGIKHIAFNCAFCLEQITEQTAAVVAEPVQAEAGVTVPYLDYLKQLQARCNQVGALLILDEIQTGYGRTGSLFAHQHYGVQPDIITLAKGMGGGMPIGAFAARRKHMQTLTHDPVLGHITTFGGHPVSCAAALATLRTLQSEDHISTVAARSAIFKQRLKHKHILDVRGIGFLLAVELQDFDTVLTAISHCLERGLITDWFLFNNRCLRIAPPLIITPEEIHAACDIILEALDQLN